MFSEKDRLIYTYHNGEKTIHADPLVLRRAVALASIKLCGKTIYEICNEATHPAEGSENYLSYLARAEMAEAMLAAVVCEAFGLSKFDPQTGKGVTEAMANKVWGDWCEWLEKNVNRQQA